MTSTKYSWFCTKLKYNGLSVVPLCLAFMWLQWVYCPGSWIVLIYYQLCRHFCCGLLQISLARKFQISLLFWYRHCTTSPQAHLTFAPVSLCLASFHGAFFEAATHRTPDVDIPPRTVQPMGQESLALSGKTCFVRTGSLAGLSPTCAPSNQCGNARGTDLLPLSVLFFQPPHSYILSTTPK